MSLVVDVEDEMEGQASGSTNASQGISIRRLGRVVLSLPMLGFVLCVLLSLIYNFEGSTATHCNVRNYLPSASAAIGGFTPQRYVWRISIGLHCAPRFLYTALYYNFYVKAQKVLNHRRSLYMLLVKLTALLNIFENFCLVILTFVSSTENYHVHENGFIGFMVFSEVHMLCTIILWTWLKSSNLEIPNTLRLKVLFFVVNLSSFGAAIYFFFRHNTYCEPGVYTWFAVGEYLTIFSNIAFHGIATIDFGDKHLTVTTGSDEQQSNKTKPL